MEGDDDDDDDDNYGEAMAIDVPHPHLDQREGSPEPETDEDDEDADWDAQSSLSDSPSEILIEGDDDDVVPPSFNFPTPAADHPPDVDRSATEGESNPPSQSEENGLENPRVVYGSDSK